MILLCTRNKFFYRLLLKRVSLSQWAAAAAFAARSDGFMSRDQLTNVGTILFNDGVNFDVVTFDAQRVWPNADAVVARCAVAA